MNSAPPKVCLCPGYLGTALTCTKCGLPNGAAGFADIAVKHEAKDADGKEAKAAGAPAAAAAGAAGGQLVPAVAGDLGLAMEVLTQPQPNARVAAVEAVAANPQQFGDVVTTLADNPQVLAAAQVSLANQLRELQVRQQVVGAAQQLRNLHKRVYYIGADRIDPLFLVAVFVNTQTGVVTLIPPANVSVQNVIECTYLLVYPTSVDPQTHRTATGATGAGWLPVDNVKIVMAAHTTNPAVPVGLQFVLGGRYHLAWGGLSLARCNNLPHIVQMAVANPAAPAAPAGGAAAAAAGAGAGAKVEVMSE